MSGSVTRLAVTNIFTNDSPFYHFLLFLRRCVRIGAKKKPQIFLNLLFNATTQAPPFAKGAGGISFSSLKSPFAKGGLFQSRTRKLIVFIL
jgi:hypothetical protein